MHIRKNESTNNIRLGTYQCKNGNSAVIWMQCGVQCDAPKDCIACCNAIGGIMTDRCKGNCGYDVKAED